MLQESTQQDLRDAVLDMKKQGLQGVNVLVLGELTDWLLNIGCQAASAGASVLPVLCPLVS